MEVSVLLKLRKERLDTQLINLSEEYRSVADQLGLASGVEKARLKRLIKRLEQEIQEAQDELRGVDNELKPYTVGSQMVLRSGTHLGQYKVRKIMGFENHIQIVKAWDEKLKRPVAIKLLDFMNDQDQDLVRQFQDNLLLEANILAMLRHPSIAQIYTTISEPFGIVMEWVHDRSLQDILDESAPLSITDVIGVTSKLVEALSYIHVRGILHRNIKPGNIMLTESMEPVLADFSVARSNIYPDAARNYDGSYNYMGTKAYSAPEQIHSPGEIDTPADIFSLGIVLHELLTRRLPYDLGNDPSVYGGRLPALEPSGIPGQLYPVLCALLNERPDQRPTTARLKSVLIELAEHQSG